MDLKTFLSYLHDGAFEVFQSILQPLNNKDLKSLRLVLRDLSDSIFPYMFSRVYISCHEKDLEVLTAIADHERARWHVREMVWDDTAFDPWINGLRSYRDRLIQVATLKTHQVDTDAIAQAYSFWSAEAARFKANRAGEKDRRALELCVSRFPRLQHITLLSRSRLTYVNPLGYWRTFQTPRRRYWQQQPFTHLLLDPEPFKPSSFIPVEQSEGVRPLRLLLATMDTNRRPVVGALEISSIGGRQTRASGSPTEHRNQRTWHIDLDELTSERKSTVSAGKVALHLLVESQMEDIFCQKDLWEQLIEDTCLRATDTVEELTFSAVSLDSFWAYLQQGGLTVFTNCCSLRRVVLHGCWCIDPSAFLTFLRRCTPVREIEITTMDLDGVSWYSVLTGLRDKGILFDKFELCSCRCPSEYYGWQGSRPWVAPWNGSTNRIVPFLAGEVSVFPLWQGPG